jgi:hypothetical protein
MQIRTIRNSKIVVGNNLSTLEWPSCHGVLVIDEGSQHSWSASLVLIASLLPKFIKTR